MRPILAGIETEYGLSVEGRGPQDLVEDAMTLVRGFPGERFVGWDARFESPRVDLRGFVAEELAVDPRDAALDVGRRLTPLGQARADQVLTNGARFYNDHGHPEYATPECLGLRELALHDKAGERVVKRAAAAFEAATGRRATLYKNNTDFHGASYGTHESYLAPRSLGFDALVQAVMPMLVARQVLTGAGKVGAESGDACEYPISQRADFLSVAVGVDTLYRRPVFNTRDEPHADPARWTRLHVICGDANMTASCTARKAGLVKLAVMLAEVGACPAWRLADPVASFASVSRDLTGEGRIDLEGGGQTTARGVLESYLEAAERALAREGVEGAAELGDELVQLVGECRTLLEELLASPERFARSVDWAAKRAMLERYMESEGLGWGEPSLRSFDLAYHLLDEQQGLYPVLTETGAVEPAPDPAEVERRTRRVFEPTRARARGAAVASLGASLAEVSWGSLTVRTPGGDRDLVLHPDREYPESLEAIRDPRAFVEAIEAIHHDAR